MPIILSAKLRGTADAIHSFRMTQGRPRTHYMSRFVKLEPGPRHRVHDHSYLLHGDSGVVAFDVRSHTAVWRAAQL
jgi:hypothetical protein